MVPGPHPTLRDLSVYPCHHLVRAPCPRSSPCAASGGLFLREQQIVSLRSLPLQLLQFQETSFKAGDAEGLCLGYRAPQSAGPILLIAPVQPERPSAPADVQMSCLRLRSPSWSGGGCLAWLARGFLQLGVPQQAPGVERSSSPWPNCRQAWAACPASSVGLPACRSCPQDQPPPPCRVLLKPVAAVCGVPEVRAGWCRALRPAERRWRVQGPALCSLC